jgi:hypothetical protein
MTEITEPGIYPDMDDAEYFALPSLSHSDCKTLLDSPAKFDHLRRNPKDAQAPTADMLFGSAVHSFVLGGPTVVAIEADNFKSPKTREQRDEVLAAGSIPLLRADYDRAFDCAESVRSHALGLKLLDNADHLEVVTVWDDNGIERRAKIDGVTGRIVWDLKTTYDANTDAFGRSAAKYGYHSQSAFYMDAARACLGIDDPEFLFVVVEKRPPHLVNVIKLSDYAVDLGAKRVARALDLYRQCTESGEWPGYGDGINEAELPRWAEYEEEAA